MEISPEQIVCGEADTERNGALDDVERETLAEASPALGQNQVAQHLSEEKIRHLNVRLKQSHT